MERKILYSLMSLGIIASGANANEGFQKGLYVGASLGGASLKGKRSDWNINSAKEYVQLSKNASLKDTSEKGEAFLGCFLPIPQLSLGVSLEGFYSFSNLSHQIRYNLGLIPTAGTYLQERVKTVRSFGGNFRVGPIIQEQHFIGAILGVEFARFTRYHADWFGNEFTKVSARKAGFQYGLSYQYAWQNSSIGVELKQTRFKSITLSKADSTNAVTTTRFKPNINSLMIRYTYRLFNFS